MKTIETKELNTMTMTELFDTAFEPRLQVVKDLKRSNFLQQSLGQTGKNKGGGPDMGLPEKINNH